MTNDMVSFSPDSLHRISLPLWAAVSPWSERVLWMINLCLDQLNVSNPTNGSTLHTPESLQRTIAQGLSEMQKIQLDW